MGSGPWGLSWAATYNLICIGTAIYAAIQLATKTGMTDKQISTDWICLLVFTFLSFWCCITILYAKLNEMAPYEVRMTSLSGIVLLSWVTAPWKVALSLCPCVSLITLGVLGLLGVFTNMPHEAAMAAVITGGSLMGCCILLAMWCVFSSNRGVILDQDEQEPICSAA